MQSDLRHRESTLLSEALGALEKTTGITATVPEHTSPDERMESHADVAIALKANGQVHDYMVKARLLRERAAMLGQVREQMQTLPLPGLLVAPHVSVQMAEHCRAMQVQFIDVAGNAYLKAPGLYIFITGEKPKGEAGFLRVERGTANPSAMKMIFTLLCQPDLINAPYRDIVKTAQIALGAVGPVFQDLEKRGLLARREEGRKREFLDYPRLLDEWVANYPRILRQKLHPRRFRAPDMDWWKACHFQGSGALWGGEVAADQLTNYLKPATQTIYIKPETMAHNLQNLVRTYRLQPDPYGPIEILSTFWSVSQREENLALVPAVLAYADLMASLDPRNMDVASIIRKQHIEHADGQA